jgi:hypothetical protein
MQMAVAVDEENKIVGAITTEVHTAETGTHYLHAVTVSGERFDEWIGLANDLLQGFGRSLGAKFISMNGRRGWVKKLDKLGWHEQSVVMAINLE